MRSEIVIYGARTLAGKAIDWLWNKLANNANLQILDPEVIYCYSFHLDQFGSAHHAIRTMVYSVLCTVTVSNTRQRPETMARLELTAIVGAQRYPMHLYDPDAEGWRSSYTFAGGTAYRITWNAFIPGHGFLPVDPGMVVIEPVNVPFYFELSYSNRAGKVVVAAIEVSQARASQQQSPLVN